MDALYSIGHSNQSAEEFLSLLQMAGINCVVDVRSIPASAYTPQFNKENISIFLKKNGIYYLYFGEEFGARRTDSIINGQVNFEKAVTTESFLRGTQRIFDGLEKGYTISFMCSEANPLSCHRFSMVSRYFYDNGIAVQHILRSKEILSHSFLENQMIEELLHKRNSKLKDVSNLFGDYSIEEQRIDAYRIKNSEIGYKQSNNDENGI